MPADLPLLGEDLLARSRLQTEFLKEQRRIIDELEQQQAQLRRLTATLQAERETYHQNLLLRLARKCRTLLIPARKKPLKSGA